MRLVLAGALTLIPLSALPLAAQRAADPTEAADPTRTADPDPRRTPLVRLIERCVDAAVSIRIPAGGPERVGTGSLLHPAGYVVTNQHVVAGASGGRVQLHDGTALPFAVVAELPHEDLAVLRVEAGRPLPRLLLGRSHDLMLGEPVFAIGDAAALPFTVSRGIVSGLDRATATESAFLPAMVQTDAAVNGGNSGGPLINALGEQIGVVTSRRDDADNVAFAITADRLRAMLPALLAVDERSGHRLGLTVDPLARTARVESVVEDGPAATAGIRAGDLITRLGRFEIRDSIDYLFARLELGHDAPVPLRVRRGDETLEFTATPVPVALAPPRDVEGTEPGLDWTLYEGAWNQLPDFSTLEPSAQGTCEAPQVDVHQGRADDYALVFTGFVEIPRDGAWQFGTTSDDGSRLWIDGELVVDNDGLHGARGRAGTRRLAAGLHRIRVEFFERGGAELLELGYAGPGRTWTEIPATAFRRP